MEGREGVDGAEGPEECSLRPLPRRRGEKESKSEERERPEEFLGRGEGREEEDDEEDREFAGSENGERAGGGGGGVGIMSRGEDMAVSPSISSSQEEVLEAGSSTGGCHDGSYISCKTLPV